MVMKRTRREAALVRHAVKRALLDYEQKTVVIITANGLRMIETSLAKMRASNLLMTSRPELRLEIAPPWRKA